MPEVHYSQSSFYESAVSHPTSLFMKKANQVFENMPSFAPGQPPASHHMPVEPQGSTQFLVEESIPSLTPIEDSTSLPEPSDNLIFIFSD
jgi:hypothetical protein